MGTRHNQFAYPTLHYSLQEALTQLTAASWLLLHVCCRGNTAAAVVLLGSCNRCHTLLNCVSAHLTACLDFGRSMRQQ